MVVDDTRSVLSIILVMLGASAVVCYFSLPWSLFSLWFLDSFFFQLVTKSRSNFYIFGPIVMVLDVA